MTIAPRPSLRFFAIVPTIVAIVSVVTVAFDAVRKHFLDAVGQTVQPVHASVWLRERRT